jgi:hypothetical protein
VKELRNGAFGTKWSMKRWKAPKRITELLNLLCELNPFRCIGRL